ncbi:MAG: M56 family metallopeptidase, partial [Oscillospiraceae bacterium]|nr:M56 family metallopeptidase [Oscillospiraceae bacterium]
IRPYETVNEDGYIGVPEEYQQIVEDLVPEPWVTELVDLSAIIWYFVALFTFAFNAFAYWMFVAILKLNNVPLNIDCPIPVFRNAKAATPMLIGLFSPAIVLPDREYTDEQLHAVLLHELTHLRRKDVLVKWLSVAACSVHWFNPIVWLVRREIDRACELSCDEAVVRSLDADGRQNYGDTLLYTAADSKTPRAVLSTTMCEDKKNLKERLSAIMSGKKRTRAAVIVSAAVICAAVLTALVLGAGSGQNIPEAMPAPDYDPNFEFVNMFEVQTQPDRYTPAMSSYPGIYIATNGQAVGGAIMRYECEMGNFITFEDGIITTLGNSVEREFGAIPNLHWSPISGSEVRGNKITLSLIVDGNVRQETVLEIKDADGWYSLVPAAEN